LSAHHSLFVIPMSVTLDKQVTVARSYPENDILFDVRGHSLVFGEYAVGGKVAMVTSPRMPRNYAEPRLVRHGLKSNGWVASI
jgi:hypothetical protein